MFAFTPKQINLNLQFEIVCKMFDITSWPVHIVFKGVIFGTEKASCSYIDVF